MRAPCRLVYYGKMGKEDVHSQGTKEICEMKVTQVTADGELIEDAFDTHVMEDVSYKMQRDLPSPVEREIARRLRAVEEKLACVTDRLKRLDRKTSLREDQGKSLKAMLRQKIERLPQLMKADVLEGKIFEDVPHIMDVAVDQHHDSVDKIYGVINR
ncbi:unnamed protein product [Heligmosomoides polygyrus]|uniref:Ribosome-recycling factor n=1 Tax=Heligmosomoides polygyrus TaxID=6339 RepID=A0A183FIB1_HELPZ|nr:unnamed protein product [Heligmosomoides polygyrus]